MVCAGAADAASNTPPLASPHTTHVRSLRISTPLARKLGSGETRSVPIELTGNFARSVCTPPDSRQLLLSRCAREGPDVGQSPLWDDAREREARSGAGRGAPASDEPGCGAEPLWDQTRGSATR